MQRRILNPIPKKQKKLFLKIFSHKYPDEYESTYENVEST